MKGWRKWVAMKRGEGREWVGSRGGGGEGGGAGGEVKGEVRGVMGREGSGCGSRWVYREGVS